MQAILNLKNDLEVTASGKAYVMDFVKDGKNTRTWLPISHSKVEAGVLYVAEWLLEPRRDGVGALLKSGWQAVAGDVIVAELTPTDTPKKELQAGVIAKGFFTVQAEDEKHRTFRIKTNGKGQTLIGLMVGRNNVTDYAWFGFVDGDKIRFWRQARYEMMPYTLPVSNELIEECFNAILGNVEGAGLRYATEYKNCSRCGKVLTTPESLERGLGPECSGLGYTKKAKK